LAYLVDLVAGRSGGLLVRYEFSEDDLNLFGPHAIVRFIEQQDGDRLKGVLAGEPYGRMKLGARMASSLPRGAPDSECKIEQYFGKQKAGKDARR
jgi:hypothetical protein